MAEINVSDFVKLWKKAIILDFDKQNVWVVKHNKLKVYGKDKFKEMLSTLNYMDFGDDEE